jgi:dihydrofolate synthase/folylpolyglutamate synthase
VEDISAEKLGSVSGSGLLVLGTNAPPVVEVAREVVAVTRVRLVDASDAAYEGSAGPVPYLRHNIALGIRTAEELSGSKLDAAGQARVAQKVAGALPGRFEEFDARGVPVVVDGGHNVPGLQASLEAVRARFGERPVGVVFGALREKDIGSMLSALRCEADTLVLTRPEGGRAADPQWVLLEHGARDRDGRPARVEADVAEAVLNAVEQMRGRSGVVLVTGSLYTGAAALRALRGLHEA